MAEVGVHDADDRRPRGQESSHHRGAKTEFPGPVHNLQLAAVVRQQAVHDRSSAVRRIVVNDHELAGKPLACEHGNDGSDELGDARALVVGRDDDRNLRRYRRVGVGQVESGPRGGGVVRFCARLAARSNRTALIAWLLLAGLLAIRIPSLVQPAGADQALYAYVGQRILAGEVPYRDAWDQKPPAIHVTYAALIALWPHESVVAGADLVVAALTALSLIALGRRLSSYPGAGTAAAALFLLLANPAFGRLGGVRVRAQCEVFIALAIAAALLSAWKATTMPRGRETRVDGAGRGWLVTAGALVGIAALFKYNAVVYGLPVAALALRRADGTRRGELVKDASALIAGAIVPVAIIFSWMAGAGALKDLIDATIDYNLQYSGETYPSRPAMLLYLIDVSDSSGAARLAVVSRRTRVGCADYRGRLEPSPAGNGRWQHPPARGAAVGGGGVPCDRDQRQSRTASGTFCRPTHLLRSPPALRPRGVGPGCVLCGAR